MSLKEFIKLNNGLEIPKVGLGTWQSAPGEVSAAVVAAIEAGYRHLDLALVYGNQVEVGEALKTAKEKFGVDRKDLWITSKLWNVSHRPELVEQELDYTLGQLGIDYLDLFLIHWPVAFKPTPTPSNPKESKTFMPTVEGSDPKVAHLDLDTTVLDTWKAVTKLPATGKVRAIGVSNFTIEQLDAIIAATGVTPAVNQVEGHPLLPQTELLKYGAEKGIHLTAYSPLGNNSIGRPLLTEVDLIKEIAKAHDADAGQVLIAWGVQKGFTEIPKSVKAHRVQSNFKQIKLSDEDISKIDSWADEERKKTGHSRFNVPYTYEPKWDVNVFGDKAEEKAAGKIKIQ